MVFSWGLFYFLHSALAASKLKRILEAKWPNHYKWYRLIYSIFSSILFLGILIQAIYLPLEYIFSPGRFSQYAGYMVATAGVVIMLRAARQISMGSFFGFRPDSTADSSSELVISGIYSQIRHPLYLGLLGIFLGYFLVAGTVGALIHLGCLIAYLPIGIYFEEKNLVSVFGESYRDYQKEVPTFFPKFHKKRS
ncbi:Protein-S-isoprenylcysteine O-methyltransferase Ste14 [Algoriphagus boritolerans DSM 17298 = JCM 18970]|uniref:Protein-S-isoprenylcysteine O-methyltransferase Ste14 n=2 Tax=Algoriphagus TaxID=246875 RepID=A0A1H6ABJ5_9BACT|nr:Protein-S-isoprenylcysteine O-methyltransferase Ste14 [Algoriphagus boritolerans DSM 17298 = JCM 18970]